MIKSVFTTRLRQNVGGMTSGELIEVLKDLPPDTPLNLLGEEVSYPLTAVELYTRERNPSRSKGVYLI